MTTNTLQHTRYVISQNLITFGAFGLFLVLVLFAIFGTAIAPYDPLASNSAIALQPPSEPIGLAPISWGGCAQSGDGGHPVGPGHCRVGGGPVVFGGQRSGHLRGLLWRLVRPDYFPLHRYLMAFPLFVLAMGLVAALGNTVANIIYATAIINLPLYTRVIRSEI
jgi:peptide/nickel transport system permease protein